MVGEGGVCARKGPCSGLNHRFGIELMSSRKAENQTDEIIHFEKKPSLY